MHPPQNQTQPKRPSVVSLFSGCGGLDLGFLDAGFELLWANELETDACATYRQNIGSEIVAGDINELLDSIPKATILIGGPPCQAFSLVGRRVPEDPRAKLVFSFVEAVKRVEPDAFVMENVPGMAAAKVDGDRLSDYLTIAFERIGYQVEVLSLIATDFFVPQKRKRLIMVGRRIGRSNASPFSMLSPEDFAARIGRLGLSGPTSAKSALEDLGDTVKSPSELSEYSTRPTTAYAKLMRPSNAKSVSLHFAQTMSWRDREYVRHIPPGGNYRSIPDELATPRVMRIKATGGRTTTYARLHPDEPSYTVNTYFNRPNVGSNFHYDAERLITPREALRLQSFPDTFEVSFRNRRSLHKQIGNAVPPLLARAIAESLAADFQW